jgi:glycosyltransferase involved in cell wall biosynthesis
MRVLVVVPAYNEEATILSVARRIEGYGYDYVIINDGSSDSTAHICQENGLNFVNLSRNLGIGGAVQTGHLYAREHGYDVDVQVDGDGQHDISYLPKLLEGIADGADLVVGSRFIEQSDGFQSTGTRRAGIRWLQRCIHRTCGLTITDATSGFRASGRRAISLFSEQYPSDYPEPESIVVAHNAGLTVAEVPVVMRERQGGTSSIHALSGAYYMIKVTLAIFIEGIGNKRGIGEQS